MAKLKLIDTVEIVSDKITNKNRRCTYAERKTYHQLG